MRTTLLPAGSGCGCMGPRPQKRWCIQWWQESIWSLRLDEQRPEKTNKLVDADWLLRLDRGEHAPWADTCNFAFEQCRFRQLTMTRTTLGLSGWNWCICSNLLACNCLLYWTTDGDCTRNVLIVCNCTPPEGITLHKNQCSTSLQIILLSPKCWEQDIQDKYNRLTGGRKLVK